MSGGVDSSVAAALLRDAGHEVTGATLQLWGGPSDAGCCSARDVDDARRVAQVLGIDHHVFSYTEAFEREVVTPFIEGHARGETPNPCVACNRAIKFDLLVARAERLGFDAVATGHHARRSEFLGHPVVARGRDPRKDQSYVLGFLTATTVARLLLPIGELTKDEVRAAARQHGLRTADKPESQDVCFVETSVGRREFLAARVPLTPATVIDRASGATLGRTEAAELLTVGQRRHLPPMAGPRRYVTRVDLARGRVEVDTLDRALSRVVALDPASVTFAGAPLPDRARVLAQRSAHGDASWGEWRGGPRPLVHLDQPARPVAPGQAVVLYASDDPDCVVGAALAAAP